MKHLKLFEEMSSPMEIVDLKQDYESKFRLYKKGTVLKPTGRMNKADQIETIQVGNFEPAKDGKQMTKEGAILWVPIEDYNNMLKLS